MPPLEDATIAQFSTDATEPHESLECRRPTRRRRVRERRNGHCRAAEAASRLSYSAVVELVGASAAAICSNQALLYLNQALLYLNQALFPLQTPALAELGRRRCGRCARQTLAESVVVAVRVGVWILCMGAEPSCTRAYTRDGHVQHPLLQSGTHSTRWTVRVRRCGNLASRTRTSRTSAMHNLH